MAEPISGEDSEVIDLLHWAWGPGNVPGLVIAYQVTGKKALLDNIRRLREDLT
jgi:hypothetical protein